MMEAGNKSNSAGLEFIRRRKDASPAEIYQAETETKKLAENYKWWRWYYERHKEKHGC